MLLIYTKAITSRLEYVLDFIFNGQFGLQYELCDNENIFINTQSTEKIIYAAEQIGDGFFIQSHILLFETDIKHFKVQVEKKDDTTLFFSSLNDDLGFDVFAAVFYLLSRYEEYFDKPKDKFGNYDYRNSILHQHKLLQTPVIEQWLEALKAALIKKFPSLQFKKKKPGFALTFDVDVAYAYKNRSAARTIGGIFKKIIRLQFSQLAEQLLTLLNLKKDMYDTFAYILKTIKNNRAVFFFNMGKYGTFDKNPSYKNKKFRALIAAISKTQMVGLHPSYASNTNAFLVENEKQRLENIIQKKITASRQHYLKLELPSTCNQLLKNNIVNDFTMGYHDTYGFRAGTSQSFLFFNLKENKTNALRMHPFALMEGTFNDVLHMQIEDAKQIVSIMINKIYASNGLFIPVWHNSTLSDSEHWKGWRKVFEHMLKELEIKGFENTLS